MDFKEWMYKKHMDTINNPIFILKCAMVYARNEPLKIYHELRRYKA